MTTVVCSLETIRLPLASTSPPTTTRTRFTSVLPSEASTTITRSPAAVPEPTEDVALVVALAALLELLLVARAPVADVV